MGKTQQGRLAPFPSERRRFFHLLALLMGVSLVLAGCATEPMGPDEAQGAPPPSVEVYFYPTKGQSLEQQERDRYECYLWAKDKTGFDPSLPGLAPGQRVQVVPTTPPGQKAATGALLGAMLGAATSERGEKGEGAVRGAIAGALIGAASESAEQQRAQEIQRNEQAKIDARLERQAEEYRRAMTACLEGRGYNVK